MMDGKPRCLLEYDAISYTLPSKTTHSNRLLLRSSQHEAASSTLEYIVPSSPPSLANSTESVFSVHCVSRFHRVLMKRVLIKRTSTKRVKSEAEKKRQGS
jgi:hypothetical protein